MMLLNKNMPQTKLIEIAPFRYLKQTVKSQSIPLCSNEAYSAEHTKMILVVLNKHIDNYTNENYADNSDANQYYEKIKKLWSNAHYVAITDGAIRIVDILNKKLIGMDCTNNILVPNLIVGDFDSADFNTLLKYQNLGTKIVKEEDQNETDFTKCLRVLGNELKGNLYYLGSNKNDLDVQIKDHYEIIVLGGLNGRFDHIMASINTFHIVYNEWVKFISKQSETCFLYPPFIQIISDQSLAFLVAPKFEYLINLNTGFEGDTCGIIPFLGKCNGISTTGLKWNLDSSKVFEFGHMISTSNKLNYDPKKFTNKKVSIHSCEMPIIFTIELNHNTISLM